jgi:hypothetical protein
MPHPKDRTITQTFIMPNRIVAGQRQQYYQFTFQGDFVQFVTVYDNMTSSWLWLVTNYQSVFSNAMNVPGITSI